MAQGYRIVCVGLLLSMALVGAAQARPPETSAVTESASPVEARGEAYGRLMRAILLARRGEFRAAAGEIHSAMALQPDSPDLLIQGADLMLWMGRRQEAEELGHRAMELAPDHARSIRFMADIAADRALGSRPDEESRLEAIRLYQRLGELGEEDPEALRRLISLHLQAGDRQSALETAEQLVRMRPGDAQVAELLVRLKADQGKLGEALRHALDYVARHPDEGPLLRLAEELARQLGAWDLVDEILSGDDGLGDRPVAAQGLRAEALIQLNRVHEATGAWEQALALDPSNRRIRFNLATAYRRVGRLADAAELARGLAEESPGEARVQLLYAEALEAQGDDDGALEAFGTALRILIAADPSESSPIRDVIRGRMILTYIERGQLNAARDLAQDLESPERPEAVELLVELAIARGDWGAARQEIRKLRAAGETAGADLLEAELFILDGRWAKAAAKAEEAIAAMGPGARVRLAELYLDNDKPGEGEALLREWVADDPRNPDAQFTLGSYLYRAGDFPAAEAALREAFRLEPSHAPALNFLGYSLAERGERVEEALSLIQRALSVDEWNGAYLDSLGWALYQLGRYHEARDPLERAAREYPTDAVVLEHLGDLYARLDENELALAVWTRALHAEPEDGAALRAKIERVRSAMEQAVARGDAGAEAEAAEPNLDVPSQPH
jgi:tetratricopeptide (TPR) repeat protein